MGLLSLARTTLESYLLDRKIPTIPVSVAQLNQRAGAFVTLHHHGALRGCIGTFEANRPLVEIIQNMAIAAATQDPRFTSVKFAELSHVNIEISVLSPRKKIDSIDEIQVGQHGIFVTKGRYRGVLLPQVAIEQKWDRDIFLSHTCLKAGLSADAWKKGDVLIEVYEAEVFGEGKDYI